LYTLGEYIIISRCAKNVRRVEKTRVIQSAYQPSNIPDLRGDISIFEDNTVTDQEKVTLLKKIIFAFQDAIPGCSFRYFLSFEQDPATGASNNVHIILLQIVGEIYGGNMIVPVIIRNRGIYSVFPFRSEDEIQPPINKLDGSEELITLLKDYNYDYEKYQSIAERVKQAIITDGIRMRSSIQAIYEIGEDIFEPDIETISTESKLFKYINAHFNLDPTLITYVESMENGEVFTDSDKSYRLHDTDFMPLFIEPKDPADPGSYITVRYVERPGKEPRTIISTDKINRQLANGDTVDLNVKSVVIKSDDAPTTIVELHDNLVFIGGNRVAYKDANWIIKDDNIFNIIDISGIQDMTDDEISLEGMSEILAALKKLGIKSSAKIFTMIKKVGKLGGKPLKLLIQGFKTIFKPGHKQIQDQQLKYQEKALNDELNPLIDWTTSWVSTIAKTVVISGIFFGSSIPPFIISLFIIRKIDKKIRRKALQRIEFRIQGHIERINHKIRSLETRADSEEEFQIINELIRERQMYEMSLAQLVHIRVDNYNESFFNRKFPVIYTPWRPKQDLDKEKTRRYDSNEWESDVDEYGQKESSSRYW